MRRRSGAGGEAAHSISRVREQNDYTDTDQDDVSPKPRPKQRPRAPRKGFGGDGNGDNEGDVDSARSQASSSESKLRKIVMRTVVGLAMIFTFSGIIYAGHLYVCGLVVLLQSLVFKEMVNVRYRAAKEKEIPLFRTLQWSWFAVAVFYTYGDFLHEFVLDHVELLWLAPITRWHAGVSFSMYCCIFVLSVLTLKKGLYRYQVGQLTWTIVTICMIVAQLKFVAHNIFAGLFWFFFPCSLVICNDVFAYVCGMLMGRKFISVPFLNISPNKTWEGFIGAMFFTMAWGFITSGILADYPWFSCPVNKLTLSPEHDLACVPDPVFTIQDVLVPPIVGKLVKDFVFIDINALLGGTDVILRCKPIQLHALVMAVFTSLIAPFGGFWASAIKRTYGIKDFDSIIPGHGGVTDRMDCQVSRNLHASPSRIPQCNAAD
jgi:phosphatidate cytidylyltransferase